MDRMVFLLLDGVNIGDDIRESIQIWILNYRLLVMARCVVMMEQFTSLLTDYPSKSL
jgi:hypothetical protein